MKTLLSIIAMLGALFSAPTQASMVELSQDQLVDASNAIVRATVTEIWTEEDERGVVWTRAQLEVIETFKGDNRVKAYVIDQLGGRFGGNVTDMDAGALQRRRGGHLLPRDTRQRSHQPGRTQSRKVHHTDGPIQPREDCPSLRSCWEAEVRPPLHPAPQGSGPSLHDRLHRAHRGTRRARVGWPAHPRCKPQAPSTDQFARLQNINTTEVAR